MKAIRPRAARAALAVALAAERRQRARPLPPTSQPLADSDIWGGAGSPWGYVRRLPPPTPESQIQPQFRDASTIRPEFLER